LISDSAYTDAGASLVDERDAWDADVVVKVAPPEQSELAHLHTGSVLLGFLQPLTAGETIRAIARSPGYRQQRPVLP
jgi:NAD(P) transhydrogenase subunit alpha